MKLNKKLIAFGSSMFLLGGAIIPAVGESWLENIQVRKGVNLQLEGQTVQPHDASGKPMPVMLYESTTYVPVRFISEYYGKQVGWDPNTTTVSIGSQAQTTPSTDMMETLLVKVTPRYDLSAGKQIGESYFVTVDGQSAKNGWRFRDGATSVAFDWSAFVVNNVKLSFDVALEKGTDTDAYISVSDSTHVLKEFNATAQSGVTHCEVDLNGAKQFYIRGLSHTPYNYSILAFNVKLYQTD